MFSSMLDHRFKTPHFVSSFIGHEQGKTIVEKYNKKSLFFMFLKCHHHLHPLAEFERGVVDQRVEVDKNLDILHTTANTNELTTKLIIGFDFLSGC